MDASKALLKVAVVAQSAGLANHSLKLLKKKKKKASDFVSTSVGTIIGANLIKEQSDFIGSM